MKRFHFLIVALNMVFPCVSWNTLAAPPVLTYSGRDPVVLSWSTNVPSFALETRTEVGMNGAWAEWSMRPSVLGTNYVMTNTYGESIRWFRLSNWPQLRCNSQMKQIAIAFRIWELDNNERYPFHVPVSLGGTRELRAIGPDGFDSNAFKHFQVMWDELYTPSNLVCLGDLNRVAATDFENLTATNVSYRLRTGDDVYEDQPGILLMVCPIDGNTLYCDGSVTNGINY